MMTIDGELECIRRAVATDAAALAEFAARTFADTFAAFNRREDMDAHLTATYGARQQLDEIGDPRMITLLAVAGDTLRAYAQARPATPPSGIAVDRPFELRRFYADRTVHGTGLAQRLMHAVRAAARASGARQLWLGVWEKNARAIAFYTKQGFVDVGATFFDVGSDRQTDRVLIADL